MNWRSLSTIGSAFFVASSCGSGDNGYDNQTALGVAYTVHVEGNGTKPSTSDMVVFSMEQRKANGEIVLEGRGDQTYQMGTPTTYADLPDLLSALVTGDSATFKVSCEKIYTRGRPSIMEGVDYLYVDVAVKEVISKAEYMLRENAKMRDEMATDIEAIRNYLAENDITEYDSTGYGLYYKVEEMGEGDLAEQGQMIKVYWDGYLPDGTMFDGTDLRRGDVQFQVGMGQVPRALDDMVQLLAAGSKVRIWSPAKLAYGETGSPQVAANQWVWFDLDIQDPNVDLRKEQKEIEAYLRARNVEATKAPEGYYYTVEKEGTGDYPKVGQEVTVHYHGMLLDGSVFDSSVERGEPFTTPIGVGRVIEGWDLGIPKFNTGGKGTLYIPSSLAYGPNGRPGIPANSILIFEIEMISFK